MFFTNTTFGLRLTFEENSDFTIRGYDGVTILELSSLLYDFNLLHDCVALTALEDYNNYRFTQFFWYRKGRPLKPEHKLYLKKIHHNSPLGLEVLLPATVAGITIPWLIIQATDKIRNWRLNRDKLKLEVENLRLQNDNLKGERRLQQLELDNLLQERQSWETLKRITRRIEERQLTATDLEIFIINSDDEDQIGTPDNNK